MSRSMLLGASLLSMALLFGSSSITIASADDAVVKENTPASEVSIKTTADGHFETTTINRRFETAVFGMDGNPENQGFDLLQIEETRVFADGPDTDMDVKTNKEKITAYPIDKQGKGAAKFTIETDGDEVKVDGPYLIVTSWGCCALEATDAVYSLETGAYLFNSTGSDSYGRWLTMDAKGAKAERVVAFHMAPTERDDTVLKGAPNAVIVISYASQSKPLQRILVTVPKALVDNGASLDWDPKFELIDKIDPKDKDHMYVDREGDPATLFTDATVRLTLDKNTKIEIPLVGDKLKIDGVKLPKGWALVEMPL
ncbi:MAG TPA: hypothetical protein VMT54_20470 [Candidatus Cybelea sp.]|nr:hypothetical protein [Candidatus Cybelea sp.]